MDTEQELDHINRRFQNSDPLDRIQYVSDLYGSKAVFACSFQKEDMVILHMLKSINSKINVFILDTGRLHEETYSFMDMISEEWGINFTVLYPDAESLSDLISRRGINLFYRSKEERHMCCKIRKVDPLRKYLAGKSAWITGIRRSQTGAREDSQAFEWDHANGGLMKVNPIIEWKRETVDSYIQSNKIPVHPLYSMGYMSIGCAPCTRAVSTGEDERAGRWWWESGLKECGIHLRR
ncbi:MAG: phosphoadenylyl-sulfate reductase [Candidatus Thermoplasmatota archaeon]|nr:phosphoadenylyl-sulfate reductase [Candidatus Thermoplasmatota archaeon]